jgi:SAM-dependent methyltransferase
MNPPIIDLGEWLAQPAGSYIRAWEQKQFDQLTVDVFGFHALQMGLPQMNTLAANRMPHQWQSNNHLIYKTGKKDDFHNSRIALIHDFTELPFDSHSLDLVILPHVLEFAKEPHQILREVERVLIPEGRVIICGFNRRSLWAARQRIRRNFLPAHGEYISTARLKDWLKLLNMEVDQTRFGAYALPFKNEKWLQKTAFLEKLGSHLWPILGAVYMMQGIKRVRGMHLVGPAITKRKLKNTNTVPATNKTNKTNKENHHG